VLSRLDVVSRPVDVEEKVELVDATVVDVFLSTADVAASVVDRVVVAVSLVVPLLIGKVVKVLDCVDRTVVVGAFEVSGGCVVGGYTMRLSYLNGGLPKHLAQF